MGMLKNMREAKKLMNSEDFKENTSKSVEVLMELNKNQLRLENAIITMQENQAVLSEQLEKIINKIK